ncbi:CDP-alcohol phosphatidyltransferase [Phycisphaerae bacterium RAS1]|nr:CDP-alcohol phosphatidyltransferase [Phycisphaerae bacterium RAS1]
MRTRLLNRMETGPAEERRPLRAVALLPSAATLGNLLCGFFAIVLCLLSIRAGFYEVPRRAIHPQLQEFFPSYLAVAAYLIVAAMVFDALDGRLARLARRTSEFGAQLDSIADIVSFGVAPALLHLTLFLRLAVRPDGPPEIMKVQWHMALVAIMVYVSCAAIRLARYNTENIEDEAAQRRFSGLPTPGGAAALCAAMLLHEDLAFMKSALFGIDWASVLRWGIPPLVFAVGLLMVSRVNYVHVFNEYVRREHPPIHLVWLLVAIGICFYWPQGFLALLATAYLLSGLVLHFRASASPAPDADDTDMD